MSKPPFRPVNFAAPSVEAERRGDGSIVLRSGYALEPYEPHVLVYLKRWAERAPARSFLAQRRPDRTWRALGYGEAWTAARAIAQSLLSRGLGPDRPLMILSGNAIEHALLSLGGMLAGVPVAPVSPAYSMASRDHGKLKYIFDLVRPALLFVQQGRPFEAALQALDLDGVELVVADMPCAGVAATDFADLAATAVTADVDAAYDRLGPDTVAKYLFTSGSTGMPKGVINTQRMMCANQKMAEQVIRPDPSQPPVLLDWLPWNHTYGGNMNFNGVLRDGGTLHIDGGRPLPGQFEETLANLREISPTVYLNVPVGFALLAGELERDPAMARTFFKRLKRLAYGGAAMPQELFDRFQTLAVRTCGERIVFYTGWGATETGPTATSVHWASERVGLIGLPFPGVTLKMVPNGAKLELRVKGPIVMPGYLKRPDLTAAAFDEEGFYRIGDAGRFVDEADPAKGLVFDGRVVEDFKLDTGTWVNVGPLRVAVLGAAAPLLQDAVVCGQDRSCLALLAWPNLAACRKVCTHAACADSTETLLRCADVVAYLREDLSRHNAANPGASTRIARLMLLAEPPGIDANEITDKGYINQRAVLERRAALVERLYADPPADEVILVEGW